MALMALKRLYATLLLILLYFYSVSCICYLLAW